MVSRWLTAIVLAASLVLGAAATAQAAFPGANGRLVFATVDESELCSAGCTGFDIYSMTADGADVRQLTATPEREDIPTWSPDGQKIAFVRRAESGGGGQIFVMNADGSGAVAVLQGPANVTGLGWSPSGDELVYADGGEIFKLDLATGTSTNLTNSGLNENSPDWSPLGSKIAFTIPGTSGTSTNDLSTMNPDGSGQTNITPGPEGGYLPDWSPAGDRLAFGDNGTVLATIRPDGSDRTVLASGAVGRSAWSPNGARIAYVEADTNAPRTRVAAFLRIYDFGTGQIRTIPLPPPNDIGVINSVDWQPFSAAGDGYPRPKGATPLRASLGIAYRPCDSPNRTHGGPLDVGSCNPPVQASPNLTVGTLDANGPAANFTGSVRLDACASAACSGSDLRIRATLTDLRCQAGVATCDATPNQDGGPDYTGELGLVLPVRITDRNNAPAPGGGSDAATVQELDFPATVPCQANLDPLIGAECELTTSANSLAPGSAAGGMRANWQLGQVRVDDGGPDGVVATSTGAAPFAVQGVFVP